RRLAGDARRCETARRLHGDLDHRGRRLHALELMAMNELAGKVAAVTGAASGLGRAMALAFASEGMHLALADLDEPGLAQTRKQLPQGARNFSMRLDVSKGEEVEAFAQHCVSELGGIHLVCNNAGV